VVQPPNITPRQAAAAFLAGAVFGAITSGGILEERLSAGNPTVGMIVNAFMTFLSLLALGMVERRRSSGGVLLLQLLGAIVGIASVHMALRAGWIAAPSWLTERPAQFVNDGVAVFGTLAVVWACARRFDVRVLLLALFIVTAYRVSGRFWHVDVAPGGFSVSVQDLILAQFGAVALALPLYRRMTTAREES
jgi:hypothetical protein